ncbi:DJ-1/PfpI family protein [Spirillospora sp. CA-255316]
MHSTEQSTHREPPAVQGTAGHEPTGGRRGWLRFAGHYVEMVLAMFAGMFLLGGALRAVLAVADVTYSMERDPELVILEMGLTMTAGMAVWMRYRGHGRAAVLEMSAAMLAPAVVVVPLVRLEALGGHAAMTVEHVAMFPLMLAAMLRRREEYMGHAHGTRPRTARAPGARANTAGAPGRRPRSRRIARALGRGSAVLLAFLLVPAVVFATGSRAYEASRYAPPPSTATAAAAVAAATPPPHDPRKPTIAVVVGDRGANVADTLVPYDILAGTKAFNVYTVVSERRPVPLLGGLDLVPDLSFADLSRRLGGAAPDVTVVPEMPALDRTSDERVTSWLRDTASGGLILSVCTGARLVAEAGLLDGRAATSHWYRLPKLQEAHPAVRWRKGVRYLDDGNVITTGGLLSSVDGALRVVERLIGTEAAASAARSIGWRHYSPGAAAALPEARLTPGNAIVHTLNVGFRANTTTVGVMLTDGVGELELASAFAPYAEVKAARTLAIAPGGSIRSRHGLTFVRRTGPAGAEGDVDRLLVPGAAAAAARAPEVAATARRAGVPAEYLHRGPGFAFDPALRDMARTMDNPTARWAGKILEYPTGELDLSGPTWPWTISLRPFFLGAVGLAAVLAALRLVRRARVRRS